MSNIPWGWIVGGSVLGVVAGALLTSDKDKASKSFYKNRKNPMDLNEMEEAMNDVLEPALQAKISSKSEALDYLDERAKRLYAKKKLYTKAISDVGSGGTNFTKFKASSDVTTAQRTAEDRYTEEIKKLKDAIVDVNNSKSIEELKIDSPEKKAAVDALNLRESELNTALSIEEAKLGNVTNMNFFAKAYAETHILEAEQMLSKILSLRATFEDAVRQAEDEDEDDEKISSHASRNKKANDLRVKKAIEALAKRSKKIK